VKLTRLEKNIGLWVAFSFAAYVLIVVLVSLLINVGGLTGPAGLVARIYSAPNILFDWANMAGQKRQLLEHLFPPALWGALILFIGEWLRGGARINPTRPRFKSPDLLDVGNLR